MWDADDLKFKHRFTCIINGPTGSGKISFCVRFLQNLDGLCTGPNFDGDIVLCHIENSAVPIDQLAWLGRRVHIHQGLPTTFGNPQEIPSLIIFDNLLNEAYSVQICELFTKVSQYRNISVVLIS
jgi:hypothetical protein